MIDISPFTLGDMFRYSKIIEAFSWFVRAAFFYFE